MERERVVSRRGTRQQNADLVLSIERARRPNRVKTTRREGWERDLWHAYLLDGPGRYAPAANEPPADTA